MPRVRLENAYAVNVARFAICMNVQTVAKSIPERGAIHRLFREVAAIQAIILVSNYCYLPWKLVVLPPITNKRENSSIRYKYYIGTPSI